MSKTIFSIASDKKTLIFERTFNAPKSKVWKAYTTAELIAKWWGPRGWNTEIKHMDFSNGGYWVYGMKCLDPEQKEWYGKTSWGKSTYENIIPEDSFEYIDEFCDDEGVAVAGMPISRTLLTMTERNGVTTVTGRTAYESAEALAQVLQMGMEEGFSQTLDRLEETIVA